MSQNLEVICAAVRLVATASATSTCSQGVLWCFFQQHSRLVHCFIHSCSDGVNEKRHTLQHLPIMQGVVTLNPPITPHSMNEVLRIVAKNLRWHNNFSMYSSSLGCSLNCSWVCTCHLKNNLQTPEKNGHLPELIIFNCHQIFILAVRKKKCNLRYFEVRLGLAHNPWRVLFWQESQIDHRRLGVAHAQIYVDAQSDGQVDDQQC